MTKKDSQGSCAPSWPRTHPRGARGRSRDRCPRQGSTRLNPVCCSQLKLLGSLDHGAGLGVVRDDGPKIFRWYARWQRQLITKSQNGRGDLKIKFDIQFPGDDAVLSDEQKE